MAFVLQDVINEIEETGILEPLKKFKKENLVKVAVHYGITPAVGATKFHILNLIKDHCVEHDIIKGEEEKPIVETAEIVRIKLDFEREERRLAREAEKALQANLPHNVKKLKRLGKQRKLTLREPAKQQKLKLRELAKQRKLKLKKLEI